MTKASDTPHDPNFYNNRRLAKQRMCMEWLQIHRPDVYQAIVDEVSRLYPVRKETPSYLPDKLQRMK